MTRNKSIYLLVDTSGSMEGIGMKSLDEVVENVIPRLKSVQSSQPDVKLGIGVIGFGDTAVWITPTSVSVDQWIWQGLDSKGFTAMGGALRLLHERLAEEDNNASFLSPLILIASDGGPTDEYEQTLAQLHSLDNFKSATRIAIAIGDDADRETLREITGSDTRIFTTDQIDQIINAIENNLYI